MASKKRKKRAKAKSKVIKKKRVVRYFWSKGRFRDIKGRFRKPPKPEQIKIKKGRPVDFAGKYIPVRFKPKPVKKPKPKPRPKPVKKPKPKPRPKPVKKPKPKPRPKPVKKPKPKPRPKPVKKPKPKPRPKPVKKPKPKPIEIIPEPVEIIPEPIEIPKPLKVPKPKVLEIGIADVLWQTKDHLQISPDEQHFKNFSHMNRQEITNKHLQEVFSEALKGHLGKSGFEADEITMYDFGILLRPTDNTIDDLFLKRLHEIDSSLVITRVHEGPGQDSILISFGAPKIPASADAIANQFENKASLLNKIYWEFLDWYDEEPMWSVWWDTDEELY